MRIAICDDLPDHLEQIRKMVLTWSSKPPDLTVSCFDNGDSFLQAHSAEPFDIVLLDVVMPLLSGMETARELRQSDKSVKLVFLTSSAEFAVDAFSVKASNYLLKPLDANKLYRCLEELSEDILQNAKWILVKDRYGFHRIALQDIEFVESDNKYIHFFLVNKTTLTSSDPLYAYEHKLLLADGFFKCSRSYIVNLHRIDSFSAKEIRMRSGYRIPISRSCQKEFETAYFTTLFGKAGDL